MKIKEHIKEHKDAYIAGTVCGVVFAGITALIMKRYASQCIGRGIAVTADRGIAVVADGSTVGNISLISSKRKGSPSWVIRCIETGEVYASQKAAALAMDLSSTDLSQHLNGRKPHAQGYTFDRIAMAA